MYLGPPVPRRGVYFCARKGYNVRMAYTRHTRKKGRNRPTIAGPVKITKADGSVEYKKPYAGVKCSKKPPAFNGIAALSLGRHEYPNYIKSEAWYSRRADFLKKYGSCYICSSVEDLQVHHRTYKNLGREPDKDLTTLCDSCHNDLHKYMDKNFLSVEDASRRFLAREKQPTRPI